jgi:prevent-host-death family protein
MSESPTITATEFKAKCLDLLDRVGRGQLPRLVVAKPGKPVAVVITPPGEAADIESLHGFMRGSVVIPPGFDLTEPISSETWSAAEGRIHC